MNMSDIDKILIETAKVTMAHSALSTMDVEFHLRAVSLSDLAEAMDIMSDPETARRAKMITCFAQEYQKAFGKSETPTLKGTEQNEQHNQTNEKD